jgi:hypothetical protein
MWCIPPLQNAEFVCAMENVLEVYKRPYDPQHPVVCFDEQSKQLVGEIRKPIPAVAGRPKRRDYQYERNGTANLFMLNEPLAGRRHVTVTSRRTKLDFAGQMKMLVDELYPQVPVITLVMDNLNTHHMSSLYEAFAPEEARRIMGKIQVVHTPKHGSWLNMAECELSVLQRQCLADRIPNQQALRARIAIWNADRNNRSKKVNWQFRTADARIKLRRLYPVIQME